MKRFLRFQVIAVFLSQLFSSVQAQEVVIPDLQLKAAIWTTLGRPLPPGVLTADDMLSLTHLGANGRFVRDLTGLGAAHNLVTLDLTGIFLTSLTIPPGLTNLTSLDLPVNQLTNLVFGGEVPKLQTLNLNDNLFTHCSFLEGVASLKILRFSGNRPTQLTLPPGLTSLTELYLKSTPLENLTLPPGLSNLRVLALDYNPLTTLNLPGDLRSLASLSLVSTQFRALSLPPGLTALVDLTITSEVLTNLTLPADMTNLWDLEVRGTQIKDLTVPPGFSQLVALNLNGNPQLRHVTLSEGVVNVRNATVLGSPVDWVVMPDSLAQGGLKSWVAQLRSQGVLVTEHLPPLRVEQARLTAAGAFEFAITGPVGFYRIEASADLSHWIYFGPVQITLGSTARRTVSSNPRGEHAFYRVIPFP